MLPHSKTPVRLWCALLGAAVLLLAGPGLSLARAAPVRFDSLEVQLWPDYDRSAVLVMYRGTLTPGTSLPATLQFRIPSAAGEPNAVAYRDDTGNLLVAPHARSVSGDWATIEFTTPSAQVQLEYYAPIQDQGGTREFTYTWPGEIAVDHFIYEVQQPSAATDMNIMPQPTDQGESQGGLTVYSREIPAPLGQSIEVSVSYRSDGSLTAPGTGAPAPSPAPSTNVGPATGVPSTPITPPGAAASGPAAPGPAQHDQDPLFWIGVGVLITLVIGAMVFALTRRRQ